MDAFRAEDWEAPVVSPATELEGSADSPAVLKGERGTEWPVETGSSNSAASSTPSPRLEAQPVADAEAALALVRGLAIAEAPVPSGVSLPTAGASTRSQASAPTGNAGSGHSEGADIIGASGPGVSELLPQSFSNGAYHFTGNRNIDAVLYGSRWTEATITYSFPTQGSFYGTGYDRDLNIGHQTMDPAQQAAIRYGIGLISSYTNLGFQEITEEATVHARLRFSESTDPDATGGTYHPPSARTDAGDIWMGEGASFDNPAIGNAIFATHLRALGLVVGLKVGSLNYTTADLSGELNPGGPARFGSRNLEAAQDSPAFSVMTFTGASTAGTPSAPQTFMQLDIAALQHLYGADYTTRAGNTVYSWNPTTARCSPTASAMACRRPTLS